MSVSFVDCSSNNPLPDLHAYWGAGYRELMRKVSEGTGYRWDDGRAVARAFHELGGRVHHYHWLRPDSEPRAQAVYFVTCVRPELRPGELLVTDYEATYENGQRVDDGTDAQRAHDLDVFTSVVATLLPGHPQAVYTGNWYLENKPLMQAAVRKHDVIISNYDPIPNAAVPNPYRLRYIIRQRTDRAVVPGFAEPVDLNEWLSAPHPITPEGLSIMDAETKKYLDAQFAALKAQFAALKASVEWPNIGSDGQAHKVETTVAHVTQAQPYASQRGAVWPALARAAARIVGKG